MARGALKTKTVAIAVSMAVCSVIAAAAPVARAGDIWVTDGNMNGGQTGGCGAFAAAGDFGIYPGYGTPIFTVPSACPMSIAAGSIVPPGQNAYWMTTAPPGVTIVSAWTANGDVTSGGINTGGWAVGDFWRDVNSGAYGGSTLANGQEWFNTGLEGSSNIDSQIYGIQLVCTLSTICLGFGPPQFSVSGIELEGIENSAPSVMGQGSLWGSGSWVWNPPGDAWPVTLYASDVSGICDTWAQAGNVQLNGPAEPRDNTVWQQCPNPASWSFSVDTRSQVPTQGNLQIDLSAINAAGVPYTVPKTVAVDNDPVGVSFRAPNDPSPSVWVNHAVTVDASPSAGPSGVGGMNCAVDGGSAKPYPASGLTVNGDGVHTVTCTAWNDAVDPQGQPNTGTGSMTVHIDEAPPSLSFEPQNPSDPAQVVVDTGDAESGVAGGSIEMAPAGSGSWTSLPASFDGAHLLTNIDDAGLRGPYTIRATSCDNVGNCASATETLTMPLRLAAASDVGFTTIGSPTQVVKKRVLVAFHYERERRHGRTVKVKAGGHYRTIRLVIAADMRCGYKLVQTGPHRWREITACRPLGLRVATSTQVGYGKSFTVHGLLITTQGVPVAGVPVSILTAPDNGLNKFTEAASATTSSTGAWTAILPPGPSRIIQAVYSGSATVLPATGEASVSVPARIKLSVSPRALPWSGLLTLRGQLEGGYVPPDGVALRLLVRYPGSTRPSPLLALRTDENGGFTIDWSYHAGQGVETLPFSIATTATESDYPYAASQAPWTDVTFGRPTRRPCCRSG